MIALDPEKEQSLYKLPCEKGDTIDVKKATKLIKKVIWKRTNELVERSSNNKHRMQAINTRVIPVAGYIMNEQNSDRWIEASWKRWKEESVDPPLVLLVLVRVWTSFFF